jgi:AraC-like DNA-binding protein
MRNDERLEAFLLGLKHMEGIQYIVVCIMGANFNPETPEPIRGQLQEFSKLKRMFNNTLHIFNIEETSTYWFSRERTEMVIIHGLTADDNVHSFMGQLTANAGKIFKYPITFACGELIYNANDIKPSIDISLAYADYARLLSNRFDFIDPVVRAELRKALLTEYPSFELDNYERALINSVFQGDFTQAELITNYFLVSHFLGPFVNFIGFRERIYDILRLVLALVSKNPSKVHIEKQGITNAWERILRGVKIREIQVAISDFFILISDYVKPMRKYSINHRKMQSVIDYIKANFTDPLISESQVCEKFDISVSRLSHLFTERTGMSFAFFLQTMRIEKAKQMIISTDDSMDVIAKTIGYSSAVSMLKLFKRIEGLTPSQYKRNYYKALDNPHDPKMLNL